MGVLQERFFPCSSSVKISVGFLVHVLLFILFSLATASADKDVAMSRDEEANLKKITDGTNRFAIDLYKELIKREQGENVFVSPLSAQMVLALAYTGAGGDTARELKSLLSLPDSLNETLFMYQGLVKSLKQPALKLANRMFVEMSSRLKKDFQNNAKKYFLAPSEPLAFKKAPEQCRQHINLWVEKQTNKKIKNFLPKGAISKNTRMLLVNAIHFNADWKLKFDKNKTKEEPFHISKTETKPVKMMHMKRDLGFTKSKALKAKILELKYVKMNYRMLLILPDEIDGLAELEAKLDKANIFDELKDLSQLTVNVALPKFKLDKKMYLKSILQSMGLETMFGGKADFSKMSDKPLFASEMFQKAFVEVNEKGTEAAAATGFISTLSGPTPEEDFIADHPFLFAITIKNSNVILFLGRFTNR